MLRKKTGEIEYLQFELLAGLKEISHGVFLRKGGVSHFPKDSLNVGRPLVDSVQNITENRKRVLKAIGAKTLAVGHQTHEDKVLLVDPYLNKGSWISKVEKSSDGIFTKQRGVALSIFHADCQAALFYDPVKKVIANVHAGWRGNRLNIYQKTIQTLKKEYDCNPRDLLVCISPSLGPKHAEFVHYKTEWPKSFHGYRLEKDHFDLWEMAYDQLLNEGVLKEHIEVAKSALMRIKLTFFHIEEIKRLQEMQP